MDAPSQGDTYTFERTFTREDVEQFAEVSQDTQARHTEPDEDGRLMVHGLLTATLPTKIGGDLDVLAASMEFEFTRPVYTGDTVTCVCTVESVEERPQRYDLSIDTVCRNESETVVLRATIDGHIWKD
ncbi:dehydratase [Halovenus sp. WSH3]|uniref:Dehydratase n=1 Tax=Halovenus carboxidivorans TaxID=2692199 RepID=A0A6B0T475_9EURY|nr:MaoC family dehydratase N-terminal domain-containing protein [Halovenus carboxidivorans]MXR50011.1 dehydratase [Halovenus carboxidivorans]